MNRTLFRVGAGKVADAHQKLAGDLAAGINLEPITDDAGVRQQPRAVGLVVCCNGGNVKPVVGRPKPRLVDFQYEPTEEFVVASS